MYRKASVLPFSREETRMTISVTKIADDLYMAVATPPDVEEEWSTPEPFRGRQLTRELLERGAHQTDIGDAMYRQDPLWVEKLRDPYIPPRSTRPKPESF